MDGCGALRHGGKLRVVARDSADGRRATAADEHAGAG
jgi:hypothetical protein